MNGMKGTTDQMYSDASNIEKAPEHLINFSRFEAICHIRKKPVRSTSYNSLVTSLVDWRNFLRFHFFIFFKSEAGIIFMGTSHFPKLRMSGQPSNEENEW